MRVRVVKRGLQLTFPISSKFENPPFIFSSRSLCSSYILRLNVPICRVEVECENQSFMDNDADETSSLYYTSTVK